MDPQAAPPDWINSERKWFKKTSKNQRNSMEKLLLVKGHLITNNLTDDFPSGCSAFGSLVFYAATPLYSIN
jgi:hypothetical protein